MERPTTKTVSRFLGLVGLIVTMLTASSATARAQDAGDGARGKRIFKKCSTCHMVGAEARNRVGPILTGVVGRPVASVDGYRYGNSIRALAETGMVWTEQEIAAYLQHPRNYLRAKLGDKSARSAMPFKLKKPGDRADVIAYLKSISP